MLVHTSPQSHMRSNATLALTLAVLMPLNHLLAPPSTPEPWWVSPEIRDLNGTQLRSSSQWLVLVFLDRDCPISNAYLPVLNQIAREFRSENVTLLGVHCDPSAQMESLRIHA